MRSSREGLGGRDGNRATVAGAPDRGGGTPACSPDRPHRGRSPDLSRPHAASFLTSSSTFFGSGGTFGSSVTHLYRTMPLRSRTNTDRFATPSRPMLPNRSYCTPYARLTVRFQSLKSG